jgi:hypothetical protein
MLSPESSKVVRTVVPEGKEALPFEVVVEHITVDPQSGDTSMAYRMLELWTKGRLYIIDSSFMCIEVIDRKTRQTDPNHPFLNSRLIGGQRVDGTTVKQIKPFPIVGTSAVFEKASRPGQPKASQVTSTVMRVALHVRVADVASAPGIGDLSGVGLRIPKL